MRDTWDEQAEHDRDLEYESRQDYESWQKDEPDPEREHMRKMVEHAQDVAECEHKYREEVAAPLGVRCLKCGHFVGAHE